MSARTALLAITLTALVFLGGAPTPAIGQDEGAALLFPTSSDRDLENQIGAYLEANKGWKVDRTLYKGNEDDVLLKVGFNWDDGVPTVNYTVDAIASGRNEADEVTETRIRIATYYKLGITADHAMRSRALEALNEYHEKYWMPHRVYLDSDGDVIFESSLNIPGIFSPMHAEVVADAIARSNSGWRTLHEHLDKAGLLVH